MNLRIAVSLIVAASRCSHASTAAAPAGALRPLRIHHDRDPGRRSAVGGSAAGAAALGQFPRGGAITKSRHQQQQPSKSRSAPVKENPKKNKRQQPSSPASAVSDPATSSSPSALRQRLKVGFYFGLWYALNVYYNIINKKLLNVLPLPWAVGSVQLGIGMLYVCLLWLLRLRNVPVLAPGAPPALAAVGFWHCLGQLFSMVSLGAGPVSFTHIVKALEPFFSAGVSALWLHQYMAWPVYASLIPVVGGVGYACLKEREFSWLSFWMAMGSNVAFAFRAVLSKQAMVLSKASKHLTSTNIFGLVTSVAFAASVPMAAIAEGRIALGSWNDATTDKVLRKMVEVVKPPAEEGGQPIVEMITEVIRTPAATTAKALMKAILVSGLFHYLNNEVMYMALDNVHPVTLAVGNTMKRVFIILASVVVFRNPISLQAGVGSAIGIGGVLLYSLAKQHYEAKEKREQQIESAKTPGKKRKQKQADLPYSD